jgi:hypothetical protein
MSKNSEKELFINKNMKKLEISYEEAEELWKFDHEEIDNEEVNAIEQKTAPPKEKAPSKIGKVLTMKAKKKADAEKELIIKKVFDFVSENMLGAKKMTSTKISFKDSLGDYYTVAITKHKTKPDGYDLPEKVEEEEAPL